MGGENDNQTRRRCRYRSGVSSAAGPMDVRIIDGQPAGAGHEGPRIVTSRWNSLGAKVTLTFRSNPMSYSRTGIHAVVGLYLQSCRFSRSSYTFDFEGKIDGKFIGLLVSTAFSVSATQRPTVDLRDEFSRQMWPLLERQVVGVAVDEVAQRVHFDFGDGLGFHVWYDCEPCDNLLLVEDRDGAWFSVL